MDIRKSQRLAEKSGRVIEQETQPGPGTSMNRDSVCVTGDDNDHCDEVNVPDYCPHEVITPSIIHQPENIISGERSIRSLRSSTSHTSIVTRRRLLKAKAATHRAELQAARIERERNFEAARIYKERQLEESRVAAERALIEARLEEELAVLDNEDDEMLTHVSVTRWLDQSALAETNTMRNDPTQRDQCDQNLTQIHKADKNLTQIHTSDQNFDIIQLTKAITDAINQSSSPKSTGDKLLGRLSARDLPIFTGEPLEWLRFQNAYKTTSTIGQYTHEENVARLQKCLRGEAWDAVAAQLISATSAEQVMKTLEIRFGRPDLILNKLITDLKRIPKLSGTRSDLIILATKVSNCVAVIENINHIGHLHNPDLVSEIINKLTEPLIYRWMDYITDEADNEPRLPSLAKFLMRESERACKAGIIELPQKFTKPVSMTKRPVYMITEENIDTSESIKPDEEQINVNVISKGVTNNHKKCLYCSLDSHMIYSCPTFLSLPVNKRWEWICEERLCFKCINAKHQRERCTLKEKCSLCKGKHHSLLHRDDWTNKRDNNDNETTANVWNINKKQVYLKVLPISIEGPDGSVNTYGLLDEGSTITMIEKSIADEIGAVGPVTNLDIQGAVGCGNSMASNVVSISIRTKEGTYKLDKVRTVQELRLPLHCITNDILSKYTHLQDLDIEEINGRPKILIGQDNWNLIITREVREGKKNEPVASKTLLGWVLHGFTSSLTKGIPDYTFHVHSEPLDELHDLVKGFFSLENIGIEQRRYISARDKRATEILDKTSKKIGERWVTGLLWRDNEVNLPKNRKNAEYRLRLLERKMDSDPDYAKEYEKKMNSFFLNDYACEVKEPLRGDRIWYLPHFGVRNLNKPTKLRLVFDAKAETKGISLNSELLTGPNLLNSLLGVLLRFRQRLVAVSGDIKDMFLQIKIREEDRQSQSFLWRGSDRTNPFKTYQMTSMMFGATSSPTTATYILRRNAEEFSSTHPRAVLAIKRKHYVDDYLDSADTEDEMRQIIKDVTMIHKTGGFHIHGWASNRSGILKLNDDTNNNVVSLLNSEDETERTLGLHWKTVQDNLGFDLSFKKIDKEVVNGMRSPTKREVLKVVMSVFDPLGLLSPVLIQVPRFYGFQEIDNLHLHVFVDASEEAYAAVAYLQRETKVAFIAAKCRVAPLKVTTVPRLELQAAVMGSRLGETLQNEIEFSIQKRFFWTDSKTVWHWIQGNLRQNDAYISHRLANIDELTSNDEWKWIPGNINVADEATRNDKQVDFNKLKWINGPDFLTLPYEFWPVSNLDNLVEINDVTNNVLVINEYHKFIDVEKYSNWRRLVRIVGIILLFINKCKRTNNTLDNNYLSLAEKIILRQDQLETFPDETKALQSNQIIKTSSKLVPLRPLLDDFGLIVVDSRIKAIKNLPFETINPIILDGRSHVAKLIIEWKHKQIGHQNFEMLLNELKQKYHILRLRTIARSIIKRCVICRARRANCEQPIMAALPPARLEHHCRPFTFCGIDIFGPILITVGRRHEKRWMLLFTCLSIRAVHVKVVSSLSTDSTLLAIRRMGTRRGYPKQIFSDNGTNFRGADKILRASINEIFQDKRLHNEITEKGIEWRFNPPAAPHMGGVWERLVRSIKTSVFAILHSRYPKEEVLMTLLAEAENIVNSRPLTHVSLDPNEEEALTPNHFLLGSSNVSPNTGYFDDKDLFLRNQWRLSQRLTDKFWSRWVQEYLPSLHLSQKWTRDRSSNLQVGDLVIIADHTAPRNTWIRGKIIATVPGKDGRVRIVDVDTIGGVLRRPANKTVVLLRTNELLE